MRYVPYFDSFPRWWFKPAKPVRHQQTCPVCGRKLVNTYLKDGEWKCRRCWEEYDKTWLAYRRRPEEVTTWQQ